MQYSKEQLRDTTFEDSAMATVLFLILLLNSSSAVVLDCSYNSDTNYAVIGKVYQCAVQKSLSLLSRDDLVIEAAKGAHASLKSNDDVMSLQVYDKGVQYVPRGLDRVFKNLRSIYIHFSKIEEVDQATLKSLPNLIYFQIRDSELRFIEDGTFDFNPHLEVVWLINNKIFHFDANVFKNLNKISWLGLTSNVCLNTEIQGNAVEAKALIDSIKVKCYDLEFYEFKENLTRLEIEGENLRLENFKNWREKIENLEKYFKNARFSNLRHFKDKFEDLKRNLPTLLVVFLSQLDHNLKKSQLQTCSAQNLEEKVTKLSENFDSFQASIEKLSDIPAAVSKRLHKFEIEVKDIKSKIQSVERSMEQKLANLDEKMTGIIDALKVTS